MSAHNLGLDRSGNGNDWSVDRITIVDQMLDTPTNNFCTMNPISGIGTFSEGNLKVVTTVQGSAPYKQMHYGTISASSGKYYWEIVPTDVSGILLLGTSSSQPSNINQHNQWGSPGTNVYNESGDIDNGETDRTDGSSYGVGDIIGVALDMDNDRIYFAKANTWQGSANPSNGTNPYAISNSDDNEQCPIITNDHTSSNVGAIFNFGQDSSFAGEKTAQGNQDGNNIGDFYYTPPTGFLALCTKNLPATITPSEHFNAVTYTGNAATGQTITVGFQPDLVWFKSRSAGRAHVLVDAVRGVTKELKTNSTDNEEASAVDEDLTAFTSTGFTLGDTYNNSPNESGATIVAWNWKANGAGSSGSSGTGGLTPTVSANTDAGFSIVAWTGNMGLDTFSHGLSKAPEMMILKNRDNDGTNWCTWHKGLTTNKMIRLESSVAEVDGFAQFGDDTDIVVPGSTYFTVGNSNTTNATGKKIVNYLFHSVDGFSKVGAYRGNGLDDGTFVYTGFRPAYVLIRRIDGSADTFVFDNARNTYNVMDKFLEPNTVDAEATESTSNYEIDIDFVSNGFKLRGPSGGVNSSSGATYIYISFAETPFKYANAR